MRAPTLISTPLLSPGHSALTLVAVCGRHARHERADRRALADVGAVHGAAEDGLVVVDVLDEHGDQRGGGERRLAVVRRRDVERVALARLAVQRLADREQACGRRPGASEEGMQRWGVMGGR